MEAKSAARASRASSFVVVQFHARLQHPMSGVSVLANTTVAAAAAANADHTAADREAVVYLIPHFMQLPADTDGFTKQAAAGTPSSKGGQGGLGEAISPTRDCMAQALR
ncbi:TPA: hypothetical protein ACH3X3_003654 [Trebouxia sp. C0006]